MANGQTNISGGKTLVGTAQPSDVRMGMTYPDGKELRSGTLDLRNLKPENIRSGVTIGGVRGSYTPLLKKVRLPVLNGSSHLSTGEKRVIVNLPFSGVIVSIRAVGGVLLSASGYSAGYKYYTENGHSHTSIGDMYIYLAIRNSFMDIEIAKLDGGYCSAPFYGHENYTSFRLKDINLANNSLLSDYESITYKIGDDEKYCTDKKYDYTKSLFPSISEESYIKMAQAPCTLYLKGYRSINNSPNEPGYRYIGLVPTSKSYEIFKTEIEITYI